MAQRVELDRKLAERLILKLEHLATGLEKAAIAEQVELWRHPVRLLTLNFAAGLVRGFGIAVGFSVVGAAFLVVLTRLAALNIPVLGEFIAQVVRIVRTELQLP